MHISDYGVEIALDIGTTLTDVIEARILYQKPSGVTGYWPASLDTNYVVYLVDVGDIDETGVWTLQAYIRGNGYELTGVKVPLLVRERVT